MSFENTIYHEPYSVLCDPQHTPPHQGQTQTNLHVSAPLRFLIPATRYPTVANTTNRDIMIYTPPSPRESPPHTNTASPSNTNTVRLICIHNTQHRHTDTCQHHRVWRTMVNPAVANTANHDLITYTSSPGITLTHQYRPPYLYTPHATQTYRHVSASQSLVNSTVANTTTTTIDIMIYNPPNPPHPVPLPPYFCTPQATRNNVIAF
ncbi:hypothetical protein J6590_009431 [Homalodisca vitripennis]|nr:hypothetical protein J6590_009431 [Homalodisca vitripennis]